jgi:hypothetical protein
MSTVQGLGKKGLMNITQEKPTYEKLIDLSVIEAALGKAGGRWTGDRRWD